VSVVCKRAARPRGMFGGYRAAKQAENTTTHTIVWNPSGICGACAVPQTNGGRHALRQHHACMDLGRVHRGCCSFTSSEQQSRRGPAAVAYHHPRRARNTTQRAAPGAR